MAKLDSKAVEIKVGDKVKRVAGNLNPTTCNGVVHQFCIGDAGIVMDLMSAGVKVKVDKDGHESTGNTSTNLEVISSVNKSIMTNIKEAVRLAFKGEPEKSFIKAGVTDSNDVLTADGQVVFISWLLKKYGSDFKKEVVDIILADQEKK